MFGSRASSTMAQKPQTFLSSSLSMDDLIDSMETFESTPSVIEKKAKSVP
jgi:hypothetical protein